MLTYLIDVNGVVGLINRQLSWQTDMTLRIKLTLGLLLVPGTVAGVGLTPFHFPNQGRGLSLLSLPSSPLPLEVGLLNLTRGSGGAL